MNSGIYQIRNLTNNKIYIGSATTFRERKNKHFNTLRKCKHNNQKLQRAFDKYGENNLVFEILAKCPPEYLLKLEQWFLDNLKPEYNILKIAGSCLGYKHTEESKRKIKEGNLGKSKPNNAIWTDEMKKALSEKLKGKIYSEERRRNMSLAAKGKKKISTRKLTEEEKKKMCEGRLKSGYKGNQVVQLDKNGNFIQSFKSLTLAAKHLNIHVSSICDGCKGRCKLIKGYKWMYQKDYQDFMANEKQ